MSDHSQAPALTVRDDRCAAGPRNACVHTMGAVASLLPTQGRGEKGVEEGKKEGVRCFCIQTAGRKKTVVKRLFESGIRSDHTDAVPVLTRCSPCLPAARRGGQVRGPSGAKRLSRSFEKTGGCVKAWRRGSNSQNPTPCGPFVCLRRRRKEIEVEGSLLAPLSVACRPLQASFREGS